MVSFKQFYNESQDGQIFLSLNIDNNEAIYKVAMKAKTPEELKSSMTKMKDKFPDKSKINFDKINWKEVFDAMKDA